MNNCKSYLDLKIDIPTLTGVMVEKFKQPSICKDTLMSWLNRDGDFHTFNGMPSFIRINPTNIVLLWSVDGKIVKDHYIDKKSKIDFIADKIKSRNFEQRAKGKK